MRIEDIEAVNTAKPDYIGFVFAKGRKRTVTHETAERLKAELDSRIKSVGVFLDNDADEVIELAESGVTDLIQLHGHEDSEYIRYIRSRTDKPVIKSVSVRKVEDILSADRLDVDYILLDTYTKSMIGGTGEVFDWGIIPKISKPFFLAGGIRADNIKAAVQTGAYCVDISSGAETDGKKDRDKIINLVNTVRSEENVKG